MSDPHVDACLIAPDGANKVATIYSALASIAPSFLA
jgi:hypothetical protein